MKIILAETAGFCFGVNRAVQMVYDLLKNSRKVCTLGPIIHNPQLVEELGRQGVKIVESPKEVQKDEVLVLRSHGVEAAVIEEAKESGVEYADATCPFVAKIHTIVSQANGPVLIAGDENHPEVQGIRSYVKGESLVFRNSLEHDEIFKNLNEDLFRP